MSSETVNPMPARSERPNDVAPGRSSSSSARVNRATQPGAAEDPDELAEHEPGDDPERGRVGEGVAEAAADDGHAGGEEGEDGHGEAGRERPQPVLEAVGDVHLAAQRADRGHRRARLTGTARPSSTPATVAWMPEACTSAQVASASGSRSHQDVIRRCTRTREQRRAAPARASSGPTSRSDGVEDRDDRDGDEVVDDGEGQQEGPQRGRQVRADDGEHGQGERDVGGGRDGPAPQRVARRRPAPATTATKTSAGTATPHSRGRRRGRAALAGSRRSPTTNSRLSSSPATKKKIASRPSAAHWPEGEVRCSACGPDARCRAARRRPRATGEFAHSRAATAAASSSAPPTVSVRRAVATNWASGQVGRRKMRGRCEGVRHDGSPAPAVLKDPRRGRAPPTRLPGTPVPAYRGGGPALRCAH